MFHFFITGMFFYLWTADKMKVSDQNFDDGFLIKGHLIIGDKYS